MLKVRDHFTRHGRCRLSRSSALAGVMAAALAATTTTGAAVTATPISELSGVRRPGTRRRQFCCELRHSAGHDAGLFETGFPDIVDLTQLFTKQYPNVKWSIREDPFAT